MPGEQDRSLPFMSGIEYHAELEPVNAATEFLSKVQTEGLLQLTRAIRAIANSHSIHFVENAIFTAYNHGSILTGYLTNFIANVFSGEYLRGPEIDYDEVEVTIIGGGKMGGNMAKRLNDQGLHANVVETNASTRQNLAALNLEYITLINSIDKVLHVPTQKPRVFLLMVPAKAMPEIATQLLQKLPEKDVVVELGNTHFQVTEEMYAIAHDSQAHYLAGGTSGGVLGLGGEKRGVFGARYGACFMVDGGDTYALQTVSPVLAALGRDNQYVVVGGECSGHLVKGLHNAQEYAEMDAIGQIVEYWMDGLGWSIDQVLKGMRSIQASESGSYLVDCCIYGLENGKLPEPGSIGGQTTYEMMRLVHEARQLGNPLPLVEAAIRTRLDTLSTEDLRRAVDAIDASGEETSDIPREILASRAKGSTPYLGTRVQIIQMLRMVFGGHTREMIAS